MAMDQRVKMLPNGKPLELTQEQADALRDMGAACGHRTFNLQGTMQPTDAKGMTYSLNFVIVCETCGQILRTPNTGEAA